MKIRFTTTVLFCLSLAATAQQVDRRLIEVEEFDGLKRYPYHRENADGWYARESNCRYYGAPGKGYHAQIHEGAKHTAAGKQLTRPLPAGKYKVFIRALGHQWHDKPNAVELEFGDVPVKFEWSGLRRFTWLPAQNLTLTANVDTITIRAVQFGGKGFRQLYETNTRTLAIDTIYVTADMNEEKGPTVEGATLLETGRQAPLEVLAGTVKTTRRTVEHAETPGPADKPRVAPVKLVAFDGRRNLWPNSSFEIGGGDGWWSVNNTNNFAHIFDERANLVAGHRDTHHCFSGIGYPAHIQMVLPHLVLVQQSR